MTRPVAPLTRAAFVAAALVSVAAIATGSWALTIAAALVIGWLAWRIWVEVETDERHRARRAHPTLEHTVWPPDDGEP